MFLIYYSVEYRNSTLSNIELGDHKYYQCCSSSGKKKKNYIKDKK